MFRLDFAGIPIGINNKYPLHDWCSLGHETERLPLFEVSATEQEIEEEYRRIAPEFDIVQAERNILYRKICFGMLSFDAFLIHAAAVAVDGYSYVFTAPSGTGKSTHASYWMKEFGDRAVMVNGDKPIIRKIDGKFYACGTPWRGKEGLGCAKNFPLKAVCLLERGEANSIELATGDDITDRILPQIPIPWDEVLVEKQFALLDQLISEVPIYRLRCNMSQEAAVVAYNGMNGLR